MLYILIILGTLILDRVSKLVIINKMQLGESIGVINNFFYITYWENKGAAWGIFQNGRWFLVALTTIVTIILVKLLIDSKKRVLSIALSVIISGAVGNLIDRAFRGSVTDFLDFKIFHYDFPIFNVADMCVVIGTFILMFYLIFAFEEKEKK
jgi:signal peptidase II